MNVVSMMCAASRKSRARAMRLPGVCGGGNPNQPRELTAAGWGGGQLAGLITLPRYAVQIDQSVDLGLYTPKNDEIARAALGAADLSAALPSRRSLRAHPGQRGRGRPSGNPQRVVAER